MNTEVTNETSAKIAEINDTFRKTETMTLTKGVIEFEDIVGLIRAVREYNRFTKDNDPYGEHDFGSLTWEDQKVFWKIDYYDPSFELWCDPLHPECHRVLTVMLAEEY
jgi:hypothetical protein